MAGPPTTPAPPARRSLDGIAPIVAFLVANRVAGLRWAVAAATAASIIVTVARVRRGEPLGKFLPILTALVIARGAIGIATDNEDIYFGLGIAGKLAFGAALVASALIGRPLAASLAPHVLEAPESARRHPIWHSTMKWITAIGGLYYLCSGALDIVLYRNNSVDGYVVIRFLANWPLSIIAVGAALTIAQRRLPRIAGVGSVAEMIERRMATMGLQEPPKSSETT